MNTRWITWTWIHRILPSFGYRNFSEFPTGSPRSMAWRSCARPGGGRQALGDNQEPAFMGIQLSKKLVLAGYKDLYIYIYKCIFWSYNSIPRLLEASSTQSYTRSKYNQWVNHGENTGSMILWWTCKENNLQFHCDVDIVIWVLGSLDWSACISDKSSK